MFHIVEDGFTKRELTVGLGNLRKVLKKVCEKEFPRSNRVWLFLCSAADMEYISERWY